MCVCMFFLLKIACATAGEVRKWMEAFDHAKQQVQILKWKVNSGWGINVTRTGDNLLLPVNKNATWNFFCEA